VGGFVMRALGRVPLQGDRVEVEGGTLEVTRMDGRRVDRLRFSPTRHAAVGAERGTRDG
jgi:CBS domain containing-hemolysin-like protein